MAYRNRTLHIVSMLILILAVLLPLVGSLPLAGAQGDNGSNQQQNKDKNKKQDKNANRTDKNQTPGAGALAQEAGTRPERFPAEITVNGDRFLFDRDVTLDRAGLTEVDTQNDLTILALESQGPFDRVFAEAASRPESLGRYLAEVPLGTDGTASPDNPCPAESQGLGDLQTSDGTYTFAGIEQDVATDGLQPVFTTPEGDNVLADPNDAPPRELFVDVAGGLQRYALVDDQGRPDALGETLRFGGQSFAFDADVRDSVDPGTLAAVGCAGPFRVSAPADQSAPPYGQIYVVVGPHLFSYTARGGGVSGTPAGPTPGLGSDIGSDATQPADETPAIVPVDATAEAASSTPSNQVTTPDTSSPTDVAASATETIEPAQTATSDVRATPDGSDTAIARGDFPTEIAVGGARYFLDRVVPIDVQSLKNVDHQDNLTIYGTGDAGPYERVYAAANGQTDRAARYWSEAQIGSDGTASVDAPCAAERGNFATLTLGAAQYAYAGSDPDLTTDGLQTVTTTADGQPIYAETNEQPYPELYFAANDDLHRFVLIDDSGVPANVGTSIVFDGQQFTFDGDVTGQVDEPGLPRAGCVGTYLARGEQGEKVGERTTLYVILADQTPRVLAYKAVGAVPGETVAPGTGVAETTVPIAPVATETIVPMTAPPTVAATEALPTETPVPPTETPVPPTETPVPPTETPMPPTVTPLPTATVAPTEAPPTATLAPTATEVVAVPSQVPPPTVPPATATGAAIPGTAETVAAADTVVTPALLPTVAPPPAPLSAIPENAPAPIPAAFPREIQVQGIRYLFDSEVDIDPATLVQVDTVQAEADTLTIFAPPAGQASAARMTFAQQAVAGPFARIYAEAVAGVFARYLPEAPITASGVFDVSSPCAAEATTTPFSYTFEGQQYQYAYSNVEINVSIEELRTTTIAAIGQVPKTRDGREILIRGGANKFTEVFLAGDKLDRYVGINAVGLPVTLSNLVFAETQFSYRAQVNVSVTTAGYQRIGCAGTFPLFAPPAEASGQAALTTCFTVVDNRVYQFVAKTVIKAPRGRAVIPVTIAAPPAGIVQIVLKSPRAQPAPTALPNVRVLPAPTQAGAPPSPTVVTGVIAQIPVKSRQCEGDPGQMGANGLPERLPRRIQLSGVAYGFVRKDTAGSDIKLTRIGCVGPFEAAQAEGSDLRQVIYLRSNRDAETLYRYEATTSFSVAYTVTGDAQVLTAGDQTYVRDAIWKRSIYSSVTVIVYAEDPKAAEPPRIYAVKVDGDVIAEYVPEGGDVVEAPDELKKAAEDIGINSDLVLGGGTRYLLVNLWRPVGTTTNGWVTLYSSAGEGTADALLATDPRSLDLIVYRRSGS